MCRPFLFQSMLVFVLFLAFAAMVSAQRPTKGSYVDDELLVKFSNGVSDSASKAANRAVGATVLERLGDLEWQRVKLPSGLTVDEAMARYRGMEVVEYVQSNFYYHLLATPNDPQFATGMYG